MNDLNGVKVGDILATSRFGEVSLMKVIAVGKIHITTEGGSKWSIKNGRRAGDSSGWSTLYARIATDDDKMSVRIKNAQEKIRAFVVNESNLESVIEFLAESREREN